MSNDNINRHAKMEGEKYLGFQTLKKNYRQLITSERRRISLSQAN